MNMQAQIKVGFVITLITLICLSFLPLQAQEDTSLPSVTKRSWRSWLLQGWPQENGRLTIAFALKSEAASSFSSDSLLYGCDNLGFFIAFTDLPFSNGDRVVIEMDGEYTSHVGRILDNGEEKMLVLRSGGLISTLVENDDVAFAYVGRTIVQARDGEGQREFDLRGIQTVQEWLPFFCKTAGN